MNLQTLKISGQAPEWMTEEGFSTLQRGYFNEEETPYTMYQRLAYAAASYYDNVDYWANKFFDAMWKGWLCPASPVLSNFGLDRGLPISCNLIHTGDSVDSILSKGHELGMLSKHGAGVGIYMGDVRGTGASIKGNGTSEGIIPWCKIYDTIT